MSERGAMHLANYHLFVLRPVNYPTVRACHLLRLAGATVLLFGGECVGIFTTAIREPNPKQLAPHNHRGAYPRQSQLVNIVNIVATCLHCQFNISLFLQSSQPSAQ